MNIYIVMFITLIASLVASVGQLLYKKGLSERVNGVRHALKMLKNRYVAMGVAAYFLSLPIYLFALSSAPLSVVYPTFATTFIFVALISAAFFKEKLSAMRILGTLLIFLGVVVIAISIG